MIISHQFKFIFIKTRKTAGTSVELGLSKICGPKDVVTPLSNAEEGLRKQIGGMGPGNTAVPLSSYDRTDWVRTLATGRRRRYTEHTTAAEVRGRIGRNVWEEYFTFSIERNPWDKVVSFYWWCGGDDEFGNISAFLRDYYYLPQGFDMYSKGGRILVDRVLKYEDLGAELQKLSRELSFPEEVSVEGIRAKSDHRKDTRHYREILTAEDAEMIGNIYNREIKHFGYEY